MDKKKKGFTLVELIVVLVILLILASILVPTLLGWIKKSKESRILVAAKSLYTASQSVLIDEFAVNNDTSVAPTTQSLSASGRTQEILELSEVPDDSVCCIGVKGGNAYGNYTVQYVYYEENEIAVFFDGETWNALDDCQCPGTAPIVLRGNLVSVPGSKATEAANSGKYSGNDKSILLSLEAAEREALQLYKASGQTKVVGYIIIPNEDGSYTIQKEVTNSQGFHSKDANSIMKNGYIVAVQGDKVGSNLSINPETGKVTAKPYHIYNNKWNDLAEGIDFEF